jgi:prepilin-type N-terminal cleavage/methylation domain-containing protein
MRRKAFTLIEISIVLVIIGIILAAVMKGRDLIKGSQIKEFNQVFVSQWETVAYSYYSRMSNILGDGEKNGGTVGEEPDMLMDGAESNLTIQPLLDAGIDITELIKSDSGDPFYKTIDGEFAGVQTVKLAFANYVINGKRKNVLVFMNIPNDIAQAIDTIKDGQPDGTKGSVIAVQPIGTNARRKYTLRNNGRNIDRFIVDWTDDRFNVKQMLVVLEQ